MSEQAKEQGPVSQPAEAREVCKVPPSGWSCTRPAGHDGPCAAVPCESSKASVESALAQLEEIVCTADPDKGVVMLSNDGPCDWDPELKVHVYRHEHFSPLGDALIALHQTLLADHQLACDKAAELTALRTENAALAETVAGMREAVNDELAEAVALLETICGQEIQKQAGLDPGGRSTLELAEEAIALIAEKQRREGGSDG